MEKEYPRVLIVGETFDQQRGGGITLRNLFAGWPLSHVAVAAAMKDGIQDSETCRAYYRLGRAEEWWPWPLGRFVRTPNSGLLFASASSVALPRLRDVGTAPSHLGRFFSGVSHSLGIEGALPGARGSRMLSRWAEDFGPDIVYSQCPSLQLMVILTSLLEKLGVPLAVHVMDDWPLTIYGKGLMGGFYRAKAQRMFAHLATSASLRMGICGAMARAYERRYGKTWSAVHNPVDLSRWVGAMPQASEKKVEAKHIVFAGRTGPALTTSLLDVAEAVREVNSGRPPCSLLLHLLIADKKLLGSLASNPFVELQGPIPHDEMPDVLSSADLLLLPLDFDGEWTEFAKLSMPTKTAEWMASGTPILVYAPKDTALARYAERESWGYVVGRRDPDALREAIKRLLTDDHLRRQLSVRAREVAVLNHDARIVRDRFREALLAASRGRGA